MHEINTYLSNKYGERNNISPEVLQNTLQSRIDLRKLKSILTRLIIPSLIMVGVAVTAPIFIGINFIAFLEIIIAIYSGSLLAITISHSVSLNNNYRHVDDKTKITSNHMIGLAVISSIVSIALICSNVCIPASLSIANLIIPILSGVYILLTSIYFIYCYKKIDRNVEYKFSTIELNGTNCIYFGSLDKDNQPAGSGLAFDVGWRFRYCGGWKKGKRDGKGECEHENGDTYNGNWKNDERDGGGVYKYANGEKYVGYWQNNQKHGLGRMIYKNGEKYVGYWKNNQQHGLGVLNIHEANQQHGLGVLNRHEAQNRHDAQYIINWHHDACRGWATAVYLNGDKCEGEWTGKGKWWNKIIQKGTYTWSNGDKYEGQHPTSQHQKKGTYTWSNGNKYKGWLVCNEPCGKGTMIYADGTIYEGEWFQGQKNGWGRMIYADGSTIYEGEWKNDQKHGCGVTTDANGNIHLYNWKNNERDGEGITINKTESLSKFYNHVIPNAVNNQQNRLVLTTIMQNNTQYIGWSLDNQKHVWGIFEDQDGSKYTGGWFDGQKHGWGIFEDQDGSKYTGEWKNNQKHGWGVTTDANGNIIYEGNLHDDSNHEQGINYQKREDLDCEKPFNTNLDYATLDIPMNKLCAISMSNIRNNQSVNMEFQNKTNKLITYTVNVQMILDVGLVVLSTINLCSFIFFGSSWFLSLCIAIVGIACLAVNTIHVIAAATEDKNSIATGVIIAGLLYIPMSLGFVLNSFFNIQIIQLQILSCIITGIVIAVLILLAVIAVRTLLAVIAVMDSDIKPKKPAPPEEAEKSVTPGALNNQ